MNTKLIKRKIANIITAFFNQLNLKNIILMESWPTYSDNSKYVFDEMILYLNEFDSSKYNKQFDDSVSFGFYNGGMDELRKKVEKLGYKTVIQWNRNGIK